MSIPLLWRHNGHDGVSNHQPSNCLLNHLFRLRWKNTSKLRATDICAGNSPVTGEFPAQMASHAENVAVWWRHHDRIRGMCNIGYPFDTRHKLDINNSTVWTVMQHNWQQNLSSCREHRYIVSRLSINSQDDIIMTNIVTADALLPLIAMWWDKEVYSLCCLSIRKDWNSIQKQTIFVNQRYW